MPEPRFFIINGSHSTPDDFFDAVEAKHGKYVGASLHSSPAYNHAVYGIVEFVPHLSEDEEP